MEPLKIHRKPLLSIGTALSLNAFLTGENNNKKKKKKSHKPKAMILIWLSGGPSQLETFDPHPNSPVAYGTKAINTAVKGMQFAEHYPQSAEVSNEMLVMRSLTSLEGDHERAHYMLKTGYRPDPTLIHPSIGAILCKEIEKDGIEIPRNISILPGPFPSRGGEFGDQFDAFKIGDPLYPIADLRAPVKDSRFQKRMQYLDIIEKKFSERRPKDIDTKTTLHRWTMNKAIRMMNSKQKEAFDIKLASESERKAFGDTPFGRGTLAAMRLIETGVQFVEVTLRGWDTHINNHEFHKQQAGVLDPALAALIRGLKKRGLLDDTIVLCTGEFGRTPKLNPASGRDHWPHAFSAVLAGGGFKRGHVHGATDPSGKEKKPKDAIPVEDLYATILQKFGIDPEEEYDTSIGRPIYFSKGKVRPELLQSS